METREINVIEDTLNGGFAGLFGEVVTCDTYQLRDLHFKPTTVWDIGSNVGVFARFARELWTNATIVCVEPDADNFQNLVRFTPGDNFIFINKAIGTGQMWTFENPTNGAHCVYINTGIGFPELSPEVDPRLIKTSVETILLDELEKQYPIVGGSVLKLDCECGEYAIWAHKPSMDVLRKFDYICGETHPYATHGGLVQGVKDATNNALNSLQDTHQIRIHGTSFWLTKK